MERGEAWGTVGKPSESKEGVRGAIMGESLPWQVVQRWADTVGGVPELMAVGGRPDGVKVRGLVLMRYRGMVWECIAGWNDGEHVGFVKMPVNWWWVSYPFSIGRLEEWLKGGEGEI